MSPRGIFNKTHLLSPQSDSCAVVHLVCCMRHFNPNRRSLCDCAINASKDTLQSLSLCQKAEKRRIASSTRTYLPNDRVYYHIGKRPKLKEDAILPAVWVHLGNSNLRTLDQLEQVCAASGCT